jgi:hypothetical protein
MAPDPEDLDDLRARLRATQEAAEKLAGRIPPQGWASPASAEDAAARSATATEIQALVGVLHALRDAVPEDLWEQVREIARQLLLLLRALLDVVVERLGADGGDARAGGARRSGAGPDLQDIPIA